MEELINLDKERNDAWDIVIDTESVRKQKVIEAQAALTELLKVAETALVDEGVDEETDIGSTRDTLELIVEHLAPAVKNNQIKLPSIMQGPRPENGQRTIYKEEFDQLPLNIKESFLDADVLIDKTNKAAEEEEKALMSYNSIMSKIEEGSSLENKLQVE